MNILELVRIKSGDGRRWVESWTKDYHSGHRGLIGFAIEVDDIEAVLSRVDEIRIFKFQRQSH